MCIRDRLDMGTGFNAFAGAGANAQFRTPAALPYPVIGYGTFAGIQRVYPAQ